MERVGDCDAGMRGVDCAFNAALYFRVTGVVWILTALPLLAWATPCPRRQWSASRAARISLLLVAASALCCFVDGVLASMMVGTATATFDGWLVSNTSWWTWLGWDWLRLGNFLLVLGISVFWLSWRLVASALSGLHAGDQGCGRLIIHEGLAYWAYLLMPLFHLPCAQMFSFLGYLVFLSQEEVFMMWGAWLVFGTLVLSGMACIQCYIARVRLASVDGARSLQETAFINLIQQLFIDLVVVIYAALYAAQSKPDGGIIAACHALGFIALWAMHVQVVLCFAVLRNTDPMYNQSEFDRLLSNADCSTDGVPAITVGSPGDIVINAA